MDDYEALKEAGSEITALDTLVYVKSKSAAGYELDRSDMSDLGLASGYVIDDATNGIRENLEANIRTNSRDEVLASLSVLDRFDSEDAVLARGYLLGVRTEGYYSQQLETNSSLRNMELGLYDETGRIYKEQNFVYKSYGSGVGSVYGRPGIALSGNVEFGVMLEVDTSKNNFVKEIIASTCSASIPGVGPMVGNVIKDALSSTDAMVYVTGNATAIVGNKDLISGKQTNYPVGYIQSAGVYQTSKITLGTGITGLDKAFGDTLELTHSYTVSIPTTPVSGTYERSASGKTNSVDIGVGAGWFSAGYYQNYTRPIYNSKGYKYELVKEGEHER